MPDVFVRWTDPNEIGELLGVITGACTTCGCPARVPEDVLAVGEINGKRKTVIVCEGCQPRFAEMMAAMMHAQQEAAEEFRGDFPSEEGE